jgi:hypothetical protein
MEIWEHGRMISYNQVPIIHCNKQMLLNDVQQGKELLLRKSHTSALLLWSHDAVLLRNVIPHF